jgi:hypothetical protein
MYQPHPVFETPSRNATIWRYMSFAKFVWLVAKECLYFSRLDQHDDSWEGLLPPNWDTEVKKYTRFNTYINCWHINSTESDAMWKLYGATGETIAIKTTVGGVIQALKASPTPVFIGRMKYDERERPGDCLFWPVTCKRKPFRHEKELHLCALGDSGDNPPDLTTLRNALTPLGIANRSDMEILKEIGDKSISVSIDLKHLLHEVFICPNSQSSLSDSLEYVLKDKLAHVTVRKSRI